MGAANILIGMIIGMAMSVPFGAIGAICIKRILMRGKGAGLSSGFGVAAGDTLFAGIVVFGVTQLSDWIVTFQRAIEFGGGLLILLAGLFSYLRYRKEQGEANPTQEPSRRYFLSDSSSMMLMTMANPQTIIGFSAAFAATVRFYQLESTLDSVMLVLGVFLGSISWWIGLSFALDRLRGRIQEKLLFTMHQWAALFITGLGAIIMAHAVFFGMDIAPSMAG